MKHFIIVSLAGVLTLTIMLALYYPELLEDIWLWIIGLIGPIIGFTQEIFKKAEAYLSRFQTSKK